MSAIERLERLERMALLAKDLRRMIRKELAKTQKQVDEIEASIREGEERCRFFDYWDGKHPDAWIKVGKTWRKPNQSDIGKMVRVTMQLGVNPEKLPEAELVGFTRSGELITLGTKGEGVCWPFAWIECDRNETIESDGKRYITIHVENVEFGTPPILKAAKDFKDFEALVGSLQTGIEMQVKTSPIELAQKFQEVIDKQATQPEQADPLIDEESFLKPEPGTVAEDPKPEPWIPNVGDWVKVTKPASHLGSIFWLSPEMDGFDGATMMVREFVDDNERHVFVDGVDAYAFRLDWIQPAEAPWPERWTPVIGDWVVIPGGLPLRVVSINTTYGELLYGVDGKNTKFTLGVLKPWEPRPGEKVQVINANLVYEVQSFDKTTKIVFCAGWPTGFELRSVKPYIEQPSKDAERIACNHHVCELAKPTGVTCPPDSCDIADGVRELPAADHIADASKMVPPTGYRLLDKSAKVEPRKAGDLFLSLTLADWKVLSDKSEQYANRDDWPACRKIEQPAKAQEPQYREPTQADLANGPIDVEVSDDTDCDLNWEKRQLYAILPIKCMFRYIVGNPGLAGGTQSWKHARIKVDG